MLLPAQPVHLAAQLVIVPLSVPHVKLEGTLPIKPVILVALDVLIV